MAKSLDHLYIERHDLVDRYLLRRLSEQEAVAFEEHYLSCPQCLDRLEETERLIDGLGQIAAEAGGEGGETTEDEVGEAEGEPRRGEPDRLLPGSFASWAAAAAVLLALGAAFWLGGRLGPAGPGRGHDLRQPWVPSSVVTLDRLRSGTEDAPRLLRLDPEAVRPVVLALDLNPPAGTEPDLSRPPAATYSVRLLEGERRLWGQVGVLPDRRGVLLVAIPGGFLAPGEYRLEVTGGTADGAEVEQIEYPLRVQDPSS